MHPTIGIPLLGLSVPSHGLMVGLAVLAAALAGSYYAIRFEGLEARRVCLALILIAVATLAAGRLHFVAANWPQFQHDPWRAVRFSSGALHAPGAIIGATISAALVLRLLWLPVGRFVDALAPAVGLGIFLARIGCFLHGCCYGRLCALPWCVTLPSDGSVFALQLDAGILPPGAVRSLAVHPLPLYFAAVGLGITGVLLWLRRHQRYHGQLGLVLLVLFSLSSAILEPIRVDDPTRVYWGPLPQLLWVTMGLAVLSIAGLTLAEYRHRGGNQVVASSTAH